jgi:LacI family transcriptional regulator
VPRPTMRHVAERAGVSLKTVSRVVNDEPGVSSETADRVARAISELGFQRNDLARSLRQGRSSATLGLVIEDLANPFYSAIAQAVDTLARERRFMVITGSCAEDPARERDLVLALLRRRVDALLLVPAGAERDHGWLAAEGVPVVFLDRPPRALAADCVLVDNAGGARSAVQHLIAHGHRRIACVADPEELFTAAERLAGYRAALAMAEIEPDPRLVRTEARDAAHSETIVRELLALPPGVRPTALFTGNNRHTVGAVRALRGLEHDVALVGFDDFELAELLAMPTTVVRHDAFRMGEQAATLAFERIDGSAESPRRIVMPTELVQRGSGEVPARS